MSRSHSVSYLSSYIVTRKYGLLGVLHMDGLRTHPGLSWHNLQLSYSVSTDPLKSQHSTATSQSEDVANSGYSYNKKYSKNPERIYYTISLLEAALRKQL